MSTNTAKSWDGISDFQLYLFNEGTNFRAYDMLGAHPYEKDGKKGFRFAVWAPNAKSVSLIGDFNNWQTGDIQLEPISSTGVWYVFCEGIKAKRI